MKYYISEESSDKKYLVGKLKVGPPFSSFLEIFSTEPGFLDPFETFLFMEPLIQSDLTEQIGQIVKRTVIRRKITVERLFSKKLLRTFMIELLNYTKSTR